MGKPHHSLSVSFTWSFGMESLWCECPVRVSVLRVSLQAPHINQTSPASRKCLSFESPLSSEAVWLEIRGTCFHQGFFFFMQCCLRSYPFPVRFHVIGDQMLYIPHVIPFVIKWNCIVLISKLHIRKQFKCSLYWYALSMIEIIIYPCYSPRGDSSSALDTVSVFCCCCYYYLKTQLAWGNGAAII